jgi:hypothetical protein
VTPYPAVKPVICPHVAENSLLPASFSTTRRRNRHRGFHGPVQTSGRSGSGNAADGVSFCFGPVVTSFSNFGEEGVGNGIIVAFDIYDNGNAEAPAIEIKYAGASLAIAKFAKADMVTSAFEDVEIQLARSGMLNMSYKGQKLFENVVLPAFAPTAGQFANTE